MSFRSYNSVSSGCPKREHVLDWGRPSGVWRPAGDCPTREVAMAISAASIVRGPGEIAAMVWDVTKAVFTSKFQTREFIEQAWFITSVTLLPPILVSIPFGAVISLQVGNLPGRL